MMEVKSVLKPLNSTTKNSLANQNRIEDISLLRLNDGSQIMVYVRQGSTLTGYEYQATTGDWKARLNETVFNQMTDYPLSRYPWLVSDKLVIDKNIFMMQHPNGIRFYQQDLANSRLQLLAEDANFHEVFGWNSLLFGTFYPSLDEIGVISRNTRGEISFYVANSNSFLEENIENPLFLLGVDVPITQLWSAASTGLFLTNLLHQEPSVIGLYSTGGLEFYQFDDDYMLKQIAKTTKIRKSLMKSNSTVDRLFFADLTHQLYQDILQLNSSGLYVYQYNSTQRDYALLHRHPGFSESYGWLPDYSDSVRVGDLNRDSRDDIIFTGPRGLTALTFDTEQTEWKLLFDPNQLSGKQRFATLVATLPPMPPTIVEPSIFTQDSDGNVQWTQLSKTPIASPTRESPSSTPLPVQISWLSNSLRPEKTSRIILTEKPALRWAEQWEKDFFKDLVDTASGQVRFKLPLIDISTTTAWNFQLDLYYHSQASASELLGEGWSVPLAQDYIQVDYRGSIYPEDARYDLVLKGQRKRLFLMASDEGKQRFQLAELGDGYESTITIEYHLAEQLWVIEGQDEQVIYGSANREEARNALQWSLGWPHWRGSGSDKDLLQPLVTGWYVNARVAKHSQRVLYLDYEQDEAKIAGKSYTTGLRLKTIRDDQQLRLVFNYAAKSADEYTTTNPEDNKGNVAFPVPLAHSHYLTGYGLTTADYSQNLQFAYRIDHGKRLLTAVQQSALSHDKEEVLKFGYQHFSSKPLLKSCTSPTGATVNFSFDSFEPSSAKAMLDFILKYPTKGQTKIAHGPDYVIVAFQKAGKTYFSTLNREMTKIVDNCSVDMTVSCPSVDTDIGDYTLHTYSKSFVVLVKRQREQALYFFKRRSQNWELETTVRRFSEKAFIIFSDAAIVVVDREFMLFERNASQSDWAEPHTIALSRPMTRVALHNRLVVGYDDHKFWLFYRDADSRWMKKALASALGDFKSVIDRFDLNQDTQQSLLKAMNQNGLQIFNNFIILNSLHEENGQLFSVSHLFLLDDKYGIKAKQSFQNLQENVHVLTYKHEQAGSTYQLGYKKDGNIFKIEIKVKDSGNKNVLEDSMQDFFRNTILFDIDRYSIQISRKGVHIGKDVFLQMTGTGWKSQSSPIVQTIPLGNRFVLEQSSDKKLFKLYAQDGHNNKKGLALNELALQSPGLLAIRYPFYIAYQPTVNSTQVLTFKDEKTVGPLHTFDREQLLLESDWQNLLTTVNVSSTTMELRVRPIHTSLITDQLFVTRMELTDGEVRRLTGYQHTSKSGKSTYTETVSVIPGADKSISGWYEATRTNQLSGKNVTTTEQWFDAGGKPVSPPPEKKTKAPSANQGNSTVAANPAQLFDREGKWLISDFSPYHLANESVAYYGFESYENNHFGMSNKTWDLVGTHAIKKGFSFTGESYLQLNSDASLKGVLNPRDQSMTYLASCWLRGSSPLRLGAPTSHFKAMLSTTLGQHIIGLEAQVKRQSGDWSYLEIPINFLIVKQLYQDYFRYTDAGNASSVVDLPPPENVAFSITLQVSADRQSKVDLDHIRFSPLAQNFQATVYHPLTGKITDMLQANGLVTKTLYNRLQRGIAGLQEDGDLESFTTSSRSGKLVPSPTGTIANSMPVTLLFEPEQGFYETFDPNAFVHRWRVDNEDAWSIAPGQLWHKQAAKHRIQANPTLFDKSFAAFRCFFALQDTHAALSLNWGSIWSVQWTRDAGGFGTLAVLNDRLITPLQVAGELIVMIDKSYVWLWLDGVLLLDQALPATPGAPWSAFHLEVQGQVLIEDCLVMNRPHLRIEYQNAFGEKTQVIQLVDTDTIQVTETLYDSLGREAVTSKPTIVSRATGKPLLAYRPDFTTNKNPANPQSVWQTGKLRGEVDRLNPDDHEVAYIRTDYAKNPLNEKCALGLPGPDFSVSGRYATKFSHDSGISLLDNLFPARQGYRQTVEHKSNGSKVVAVFNTQNNQVAKYVRVPSFNHLLTTFEYDKDNRLTKILPPLYHAKVGTADKIKTWRSGVPTLTPLEKEWQQALATFYTYDDGNHLVRKKTPDTGTTEYIYNTAGQKQYMFTVVSNSQTSTITYFDYDLNGQLIKTGYINKRPSNETVRQYLRHAILRDYQRIDYADDNPEPETRGRMKRFITDNADNPVIEELRFNAQQQIVSKSTMSTIGPDGADQLTEYTKQYLGSKLQTLTYPVEVDGQPFTLVHRRNRLGQIVELGTSSQPGRFARFTYQANGNVDDEEVQPDTPHKFTRKYRYNSPGFLEQISDRFLTEDIAYTEQGYGQSGFGDGMVMQTAFKASWPDTADGRWFRLKEEDLGGDFSKQCIAALQRTGYLTTNKIAVKLFRKETETALPLVCNKSSIAQKVAEKQLPRYYGHRYAYGNHQELVKAKYFTDETVSSVDPLQPNSFAKEIPGVSTQQSHSIWHKLTKAGYIIADQQQDNLATAVGKPGVSFLRDTELLADLKSLNPHYTVYFSSVQQLVMVALSQKSGVLLPDFVERFLHWTSASSKSFNDQEQQQVASQIGNMLIDKGYLFTRSSDVLKALDKKIVAVLGSYFNLIPEILRVLSQRFSHGLGNAAFDVESYAIDANGNHRLFYTGFNRYELTYRRGTNQIQSIKSSWDALFGPANNFPMQHDDQGNVNQALHAGITAIEYHPVSQRTTRMQLTNGRTLQFHYDAQGERVLKRVLDASGQLSHETYYLRDEKGRVLVDQRVQYARPDQKVVTVTAYLYGPRGLLGFIRNDTFYSVMTDHAGSIRLVVRDGQVVAAYDYMPYGALMRSFGSDPQSQIVYRFTGMEWDEETGLYNFHARLYDPSIGRFYQPDPQSQYFSPYKYAGNSPVSHIDPDGEFVVMLAFAIAGAVLGGYLGGGAANHRWNPADWDWKDSSTYLGTFGGIMAGGLLPVGFAGSAALIGGELTILAGLSVSYLTAGGAVRNWDPFKWDWDKPNTYFSLFQGFSGGTGLVGGLGVAHNFVSKVSFLRKFLFLTVSYSVGGGVTYAHGVMANGNNFAFWEWDFSNPATWAALVDGFDTGMGWPQNILEMGRGIAKLVKNPRKLGSMLGKEASKRQKLLAILKNPKHPLYKVGGSLVMVYFMGSSSNNDHDITRWNLASFSTYEGVLNGIFFGKDISNMLKFARDSRTKKLSAESTHGEKKVNKFSKELLNEIQNFQHNRKQKKYEQLMEHYFSTDDAFHYKLIDQPDSVMSKVKEFLKHGFEQWKRGKVKPPKEFQRLLLGEAQQSVESSSRKLHELQAEVDQLSKNERKIFPDEDTKFLKCGRRARRRKQIDEINFYPLPIDPVPSKEAFLNNQNNIIAEGYVLVGYHGTDGDAASDIKAGSPFTISYENHPAEHWRGVYVANDIEMALGYALGEHPRVLAVYALKTDIQKIAFTFDDINDQFDTTGRSHNELKESPSGAIFGGKESSLELLEALIKSKIKLKATILPIDEASIVNLKNFFEPQGRIRSIMNTFKELPFLTDIIKGQSDLDLIEISEDSKHIIRSVIEFQEKSQPLVKSISEILPADSVLTNRETALKIIDVLAKDPFLDEVSTSKYFDSLGVSQDSQAKLRDLVKTEYTKISELFGGSAIDVSDVRYLKGLFSKPNYELLTLLEKYKPIKNFLEFKSLTSTDQLANAKNLLGVANLSEDSFKNLKNILTNQKNLMESVEKFKNIRDFLSRDNFANEGPVQTMKTMLASSSISENDLKVGMDDVLKLNTDWKKKVINQLIDVSEIDVNFDRRNRIQAVIPAFDNIDGGLLDRIWVREIPSSNVLIHAIEEIENIRVDYFCGARGARSVDPFEERVAFTNKPASADITSSASRNFEKFWLLGWMKNIRTNLAKMGTAFLQYLPTSTTEVICGLAKTDAVNILSLQRLNNQVTPQVTGKSEQADQPTYQNFQTTDEYTANHLQGGLQLVDLLIRKVTGEHYQHLVPAIDPLHEAEARLQAGLLQCSGFSFYDHLTDSFDQD